VGNDVDITILPPGSFTDAALTYVVIGAREENNWIFVRHRERDSWELPAGHIEEGEQAGDAARRELFEESGVTEADLTVLNDYIVRIGGKVNHGRIYYAAVKRRGPLPESEIAEIQISEGSPAPATYPEAHKLFIHLLETYIRQTPGNCG
jgi:8-oxo-dGTP diphosphatase